MFVRCKSTGNWPQRITQAKLSYDVTEVLKPKRSTWDQIAPSLPNDWHGGSLKSNKLSPDSNGIRAEDIKACDDEMREMVIQIFNEIIKQNEFTPEAWKKVKIKVIHKKGSAADDQAGFRS